MPRPRPRGPLLRRAAWKPWRGLPRVCVCAENDARCLRARGGSLTAAPPTSRGCWLQGGLASASPPPHVWLGWPWACAAWSLPRSSPSRRERVAFLSRTCLGPGRSAAGQAGCAAGRGGQTGGEGGAKEPRPPWPLVGLALLRPLADQAQSRWVGQNPRVRCIPNPVGPTCRRTCSLPLTSSLGLGRVGSRPPSRPVARRGSENVRLSVGRQADLRRAALEQALC